MNEQPKIYERIVEQNREAGKGAPAEYTYIEGTNCAIIPGAPALVSAVAIEAALNSKSENTQSD